MKHFERLICRNDLLSIGNIHFEQMVDRMYLAVLQLNKANSSDAEAPFFVLFCFCVFCFFVVFFVVVFFFFLLFLSDFIHIRCKLRFMINGAILILIPIIFRSSFGMFLGEHLMRCTAPTHTHTHTNTRTHTDKHTHHH